MKRIDDLRNSLSESYKKADKLKDSTNIEEIQNCINEIKNLKEEIEKEEKKEEPISVDNSLGNEDYNANNFKSGGGIKLKNKEGMIVQAVTNEMSFQSAIKAENKTNLEIGKYIKGMVTGDWTNAIAEKSEFMALNTSTGTTLIPTPLAAQVIDLARNQMSLSDIPIIPMETNNLTIAKIIENPKFKFKKELEKASESEMSFAPIELKSKTIYGLMKLSLELLHSASNIEQVVTQAMAQAIAQAIDNAGLYGRGTDENKKVYEPLGITRVEGINIVEDVEPVELSKYAPYVRGIGKITKANGVPTTIAYNSDIDTEFSLLTDTTGQPLNAPKVVNSLNKKLSNNVLDNQALIFDSNSIVMGLQNNIAIDTSKELGFADGSVYLRVYAMLDFAVLKPKNITKINYKGYIEQVEAEVTKITENAYSM
ncbi:phage major capsid protein [Clostridium botulinum]|nr:phage major capsid protein [Clostridium botulinum]NFN47083.1 phage major capsid protein [Clostridium botulinum]